MNKSKKVLLADTFAMLFYIVAVIFVGIGFHKMYVYEKGDAFNPGVNAYVGGDAYNFIINANYAGDFFILALLCVVVGVAIQIIALLKVKIELESERQMKQGE